ncbi:Hint domain-containing protein [Sulfitobacter marinus]|uniref:Hint domain-containing protein n=1 Tax=Sulfitobacter marinus TaxID=394264 RepID=A0A1I6VCZ6_9RHOB|nr:Hint domain-containing protein [Sulfitobacter marinus]SFT11490.1 Hint domain-containing protein [Sulfitobacter marinus]
MALTWDALYLGKITGDIDLVENDGEEADNSAILVGETYGSVGDPLWDHVTEVTAINNSGQSQMLDSDNSFYYDQLRFDADDGNGLQTNFFDAASIYNATLTYTDGTTATITAVIMQDTQGNLFLAPEYQAGPDIAAMEAKAIRSLTLNSVNSPVGEAVLSRVQTEFVCFATGTMIATPDGDRLVESLTPGDMIMTHDNGPQPLKWRGARTLSFSVGEHHPQQPIEFKPDALGPGLPRHRLIVSPQHRILLHDGDREVLAPALGFVGVPGVRKMRGMRAITYHTLLLPNHEIITANGALVESFYPGRVAMEVLTAMQKLTVGMVRPAILTDPDRGFGSYVRCPISRREANALLRGSGAGNGCKPSTKLGHRPVIQ